MIRSAFYTKESGTGSRFRAFIYCSIATPLLWIEWWKTTGKYSANKTNVTTKKKTVAFEIFKVVLLREILSNISAIKISEVNFFFFVCFIVLYWKGDRKYPRVQPIPLFIRVWFFFFVVWITEIFLLIWVHCGLQMEQKKLKMLQIYQ